MRVLKLEIEKKEPETILSSVGLFHIMLLKVQPYKIIFEFKG